MKWLNQLEIVFKVVGDTTTLDRSHSYYYQVQCQLNVCEVDTCFFVVWTPDTVHIKEIKRNLDFFEMCLQTVDNLIVKAILPEIVGCWYTKPRQSLLSDVTKDVTIGIVTSGSMSEVYCYCQGPDDGSKMIHCENENCKSGQWFHFKCLHITRAP